MVRDKRKMVYHGISFLYFPSKGCCEILGSVTTDIAAWVLIGVDVVANIYQCLRIVWIRSKNPGNIEMQTNLLQGLAVTELVEFYAPLVFILITALSYFTPAGVLIGNQVLYRDSATIQILWD